VNSAISKLLEMIVVVGIYELIISFSKIKPEVNSVNVFVYGCDGGGGGCVVGGCVVGGCVVGGCVVGGCVVGGCVVGGGCTGG
jgi:hypothetical protein